MWIFSAEREWELDPDHLIRVAYWECPRNPHCDFECLLHICRFLRSNISNPRERKCLTPQHTVDVLISWCSFHWSIYREDNCDDLMQSDVSGDFFCLHFILKCCAMKTIFWNVPCWAIFNFFVGIRCHKSISNMHISYTCTIFCLSEKIQMSIFNKVYILLLQKPIVWNLACRLKLKMKRSK